jgi:hypothetical protein
VRYRDVRFSLRGVEVAPCGGDRTRLGKWRHDLSRDGAKIGGVMKVVSFILWGHLRQVDSQPSETRNLYLFTQADPRSTAIGVRRTPCYPKHWSQLRLSTTLLNKFIRSIVKISQLIREFLTERGRRPSLKHTLIGVRQSSQEQYLLLKTHLALDTVSNSWVSIRIFPRIGSSRKNT